MYSISFAPAGMCPCQSLLLFSTKVFTSRLYLSRYYSAFFWRGGLLRAIFGQNMPTCNAEHPSNVSPPVPRLGLSIRMIFFKGMPMSGKII